MEGSFAVERALLAYGSVAMVGSANGQRRCLWLLLGMTEIIFTHGWRVAELASILDNVEVE